MRICASGPSISGVSPRALSSMDAPGDWPFAGPMLPWPPSMARAVRWRRHCQLKRRAQEGRLDRVTSVILGLLLPGTFGSSCWYTRVTLAFFSFGASARALPSAEFLFGRTRGVVGPALWRLLLPGAQSGHRRKGTALRRSPTPQAAASVRLPQGLLPARSRTYHDCRESRASGL